MVNSGVDKGSGSRSREGRIFSHQEYLNRKEKGSCFKCGEPYNPMHKCANKSMRVLFCVDEEDGGDTDSEEPIEPVGSGQRANQVEYGSWNSHYTQ